VESGIPAITQPLLDHHNFFMPTYVRNAQVKGFRFHASWDPADAARVFGVEVAAAPAAEVVAR
jgi:hypothetical protein